MAPFSRIGHGFAIADPFANNPRARRLKVIKRRGSVGHNSSNSPKRIVQPDAVERISSLHQLNHSQKIIALRVIEMLRKNPSFVHADVGAILQRQLEKEERLGTFTFTNKRKGMFGEYNEVKARVGVKNVIDILKLLEREGIVELKVKRLF